jgi:hypothetical protein
VALFFAAVQDFDVTPRVSLELNVGLKCILAYSPLLSSLFNKRKIQ